VFRGSIPRVVASIADEHVKAWKSDEIFVGCSGAFTVEHLLAKYNRPVHSNDILLYSAAIGNHFAGTPLEFTLTELGANTFPYLSNYLGKSSEEDLATVLLASSLAPIAEKGGEDGSTYYSKLRLEYESQFPKLHEKMLNQIVDSGLRVDSYTSEDVVTWLDRIPTKAAVIAYPPFREVGAAAMFEKDFSLLESLFVYEKPEFTELDDDVLMGVYEKIASHKEWHFVVNRELPEFEDYLCAMGRRAMRGTNYHAYGSSGPKRFIAPVQKLEPLNAPYFRPGQELGDNLTISVIQPQQFQMIRSQFMNASIKPGRSGLSFAVLVDGVIVGAFSYVFTANYSTWDHYLPGPVAYLLSDFPVSDTDYPRLSKLVIAAALAKETQMVCARWSRKNMRAMTTTAFSKNPVSMKYRGVLKLLKKDENKINPNWHVSEDDDYYNRPWALQYGAPLGERDLDETLTWWKTKHGKRVTDES